MKEKSKRCMEGRGGEMFEGEDEWDLSECRKGQEMRKRREKGGEVHRVKDEGGILGRRERVGGKARERGEIQG